jgi:hypothetical protein
VMVTVVGLHWSPSIPPFSIAAGDVDAAAEDGEEGEVVAEAGAIIP